MNRYVDAIRNLETQKKNWIVLFILFLLILIIYGQTIFHQYCIDDQYYLWLYLEEGSSLKEHLASLKQRFWGSEYRPVTYLTILVEGLVFGRLPMVHHIFNLVYYTILCFTIFKVINHFFKNHIKSSYYFGVGVAILFLLHPSHANVVSSIKNREVILSLLFGLLALRFWLKCLDNNKIFYAFVAVVMIIIGTHAKRDILPFIFIIPLVSFIYLKEINYKKLLVPTVVLIVFLLIGFSFIENVVVEEASSTFAMQAFENPLIVTNTTLSSRIPFSFYMLSLYEKFMVWPFNYYFYFGFDSLPIINTWQPWLIAFVIAHALIAIYCVKLFFSRKKHLLLGPIIFFVSIAPFVFTIVSGYIAVRYSFIASLGFCIIVLHLIWFLFQAVDKKRVKYILAIAIFVIANLFGVLSYKRSLAWENIDKLYSTDIPKIAKSANANRMACLYYFIISEEEEDVNKQMDLLRKSQFYCDQSLDIYEIPIALEHKAKGLVRLNEIDKAIAPYNRLLQIDQNNTSALAFFAYHYKYQGNNQLSIINFEKLIAADSNRVNAYIELTQLYINTQEFENAMNLNSEFYKRGNEYDALLNFGDINIAQGDTVNGLMNFNASLNYKQEDYILEEMLRISREVGNDTMIIKLEGLL